ncbi:Phosphoserine phosphatase 1 [Actinomadura rubteroloni]|uniref:Phosphoserine phosphatase 1 n=1 Tax=Actinomadura rubteroloni TaxID=1926885 RepID=A0A2P4UQJ0_9ACTN|nr:histidine phosphatase family protein [Actinomadura rubteroloni]POM27312.1 Phosphoserine phosphatase 1 [Actinomadura rubteroloni]
MTVRLFLVAHAPTEATRSARFPDDEPLTAHGLAAARERRGALRRIDVAYRGPEARCRATAQALGLDAATDPLLADVDVAGWRGRTLSELETEDPAGLVAWMSDPDASPHGGEPLSRAMARMATWLERLPAGSLRVAAVTHPALIRAAVLHVLAAPPGGFWRIDTEPLSLTVLSRDGGRWRLRETGHPLAAG